MRVETGEAQRVVDALDPVIEGIVDGTYTTRFKG